MEAMMAHELTTHVVKFLDILKSSQTHELHEWNSIAMHRAWDWAVFVAEEVQALDESDKARLTSTLRYDGTPLLPVKTVLNVALLEQAPHEFVRAIVCSPYLLTHPLRSEIVQCAVSYYPKLSEYSSKHSTKAPSPSSQLFEDIAKRLSLTSSTSTLMRIASVLAQANPTTSVRLGSRTLVVPSHEAWRSQATTLHMLALAHGFQRQVLARAARESLSEEYFGQVGGFFNTSKATRAEWSVGKSLVVQAALLQWPADSNANQQIMDVVCKSIAQVPTRLLELSPWLAGDLCRAAPSLAKEYLPCLIAYGGSPEPTEAWPPVLLEERLGCLVVGSPSLAALCESCLAHDGLLDALIHQAQAMKSNKA